jgi:hypothetical protein
METKCGVNDLAGTWADACSVPWGYLVCGLLIRRTKYWSSRQLVGFNHTFGTASALALMAHKMPNCMLEPYSSNTNNEKVLAFLTRNRYMFPSRCDCTRGKEVSSHRMIGEAFPQMLSTSISVCGASASMPARSIDPSRMFSTRLDEEW